MIAEQQKNQIIIDNVKKYVDHFKNVDDSDILIQRMTGITNQTFKVQVKNKPSTSVIYRRFGSSQTSIIISSQDTFLNRDIQRLIYQRVSEQQLGPKIHCYIGQHTRIQEFIQCDVLQNKQMLQLPIIQRVAFTLQQFHSMKGPQQLQRKSLFKSTFFEKTDQLLTVCHKKLNMEIYNEREKELVETLKKWVRLDQIQFIKMAVAKLQKGKLIFSHNDLLANNVLIKKSNGKFIFIDYEYSGYNYPVYDIANYFNQTQYDYEIKQHPYFEIKVLPQNINQLKQKFLQCYCIAANHRSVFSGYKQALKSQSEITKVGKEVQELKRTLPIGEMLSHLMWGWWSIISCKNANIDFDYLQFSKTRYDKYLEIKKSKLWIYE